MILSKVLRRNIIIVLAVASLFVSADMCHLRPVKPFLFETQVTVYSDRNANGKLDEGEPPIPGAVVTLVSFSSVEPIQGNGKPIYSVQSYGDDSMAVLTDENGQVAFSGDTFRYYEIGILKPCGYHAVHVPRQNFKKNTAVYEVGYVPDNPQSGLSVLEIHFWLDQDGNGEQTAGENSVANADVKLYTTWDAQESPDDEGGSIGYDFNLKTDNEGKIKLELGNVCERFLVGEYSIQNMLAGTSLETTYISPNVKVIDYEIDRKIDGYEFNTSIGITSIEWGLRVTPTK